MKTNKSNNVRYFSTTIERCNPSPMKPAYERREGIPRDRMEPPRFRYNPSLTRDQKEQGYERTFFENLPTELQGLKYEDMEMPEIFKKRNIVDPDGPLIPMSETEIRHVLSNYRLTTVYHKDCLSEHELSYLLIRFHPKRQGLGWFTEEIYKDCFLAYEYKTKLVNKGFILPPLRDENGNRIVNSKLVPENFEFHPEWFTNPEIRERHGVFTDKPMGVDTRGIGINQEQSSNQQLSGQQFTSQLTLEQQQIQQQLLSQQQAMNDLCNRSKSAYMFDLQRVKDEEALLQQQPFLNTQQQLRKQELYSDRKHYEFLINQETQMQNSYNQHINQRLYYNLWHSNNSRSSYNPGSTSNLGLNNQGFNNSFGHNNNSIRYNPEEILVKIPENTKDITYGNDYLYAFENIDLINFIVMILEKFI